MEKIKTIQENSLLDRVRRYKKSKGEFKAEGNLKSFSVKLSLLDFQLEELEAVTSFFGHARLNSFCREAVLKHLEVKLPEMLEILDKEERGVILKKK